MHISWIYDDMYIYIYIFIYGVYLDPPSTSENRASTSYTHTILGLYLFCPENRRA